MPVLTAFSNRKPLHVCASLGELNDLAKVKMEKSKSARIYAQSASKVLKQAEVYGLQRDEEHAYMFYMRFLHIMQHVRNMPEFARDKEFLMSLLGKDNITKAVIEAERLSESLKNRYEEAEVRQRLEERERAAGEDAAFRDEGVGDDDDYDDDDDDFNQRRGPLGNGTTATATGGARLPKARKRTSGSPGSRSRRSATTAHPTEPSAQDGPGRSSVTPQQLYTMLDAGDVQLVLMDARPSADYAASHIMSDHCISVPEEAVKPGTTVAHVEVGLPAESRALWAARGTMDYVLLLDWSSRAEDLALGTTLHSLRDAIYKWDSVTILRSQPLVLEGGYENWLLHYPMWCSDPHVRAPPRPGPPRTHPDLFDLNYPSLEEPPPPPPPTPPPAVQDTGSSTLLAGIQPAPEQSGGSTAAASGTPQGSPDALPSSLPATAAKSIPQVDRSKKPVAPAAAQPSERTRDEAARDAASAKEKARVEKERRMRAEEKRKLEDEEKARKEHVERMRRARLEKEEKERDKGGAAPPATAGSPRESPPPHTPPDARAQRLRQQQEDAERRQREEAERLRRIRDNAEQDQRSRMQDGHAGPSRHTPPGPSAGAASHRAPGPASHLAAGLGDRPRMQRSFSSPNIAQLGMGLDEGEGEREEVDAAPRPKPQFDRASKPTPKARAQASAILPMRHLNPTYGGMGRALTGLRNLGNTCYMNSVVQCLSNTTPLAEYFLTSQYVNDVNRSNPLGRKGQVVEEFVVIVRALWSGQYRSIVPRDFKNMMGRLNEQFYGTEQHDSQELLIFLLDGLHEDVNQATRERVTEKTENMTDEYAARHAWEAYSRINKSIFVHLLHGQFRSTVECLTCHKVSRTFEVFTNLTLPLLSDSTSKCTLEDCLRRFSKPERMTDSNCYVCSHCKRPCESLKTIEIWKLPPVLIIHLKRFSYSGRWKQKLQTNVGFPLTALNMKPYIIGRDKRFSEYNLYAVSNHYGSLDGGHYTAYAHNALRNSWFKFDDHEVEFIYPKNVVTSAGYILFYSALPQRPPAMDIF